MISLLNKHKNKKGIAYIEYSDGGSENQRNNPLNELFCEHIIVLTPIEKIYLFKLNEINEREIDIKHIPKKLLGKTTANIKFAFNHIRLSKKTANQTN